MRTSIRAQIAATSQAVTDADEAFVRIAVGSVKWERQGLLQHLVIRSC
jgi:hypothetical protein